MWQLKFHFKDSLYKLIFKEVLLPSTIHYKKTSCLLEFSICILGLSNDNDNINKNNNIATSYLLCGRHCANSFKLLI